MEAKATWIKEHQLELETKGQAFIADVCHEEKGEHCPPTPVDYFIASFAGCVAYFVAKALQSRKVTPEGLRVQVKAETAEAPRRLGSFTVEVELPEGLPSALVEVARHAAEGCTVHNTLMHPPEVRFHYHIPHEIGAGPEKPRSEAQKFYSQKD